MVSGNIIERGLLIDPGVAQGLTMVRATDAQPRYSRPPPVIPPLPPCHSRESGNPGVRVGERTR